MNNMKVFIIFEENHGMIGVCANRMSCVINYLLLTDWLSRDFVISYEEKEDGIEYFTFSDMQKQNPNWKEYLQGLSFDEFNELFEGSFYLEEEEVFSD